MIFSRVNNNTSNVGPSRAATNEEGQLTTYQVFEKRARYLWSTLGLATAEAGFGRGGAGPTFQAKSAFFAVRRQTRRHACSSCSLLHTTKKIHSAPSPTFSCSWKRADLNEQNQDLVVLFNAGDAETHLVSSAHPIRGQCIWH